MAKQCLQELDEKVERERAAAVLQSAYRFHKRVRLVRRWQSMVATVTARSVGAPRGPLHGGRSTRAAPRGGVAGIFLY